MAKLDGVVSQRVGYTGGSKENKSAIWPQDAEQELVARASKKSIEDKYGKTLHTDIESPTEWWDAEEYHQDYIAKQMGRGW